MPVHSRLPALGSVADQLRVHFPLVSQIDRLFPVVIGRHRITAEADDESAYDGDCRLGGPVRALPASEVDARIAHVVPLQWIAPALRQQVAYEVRSPVDGRVVKCRHSEGVPPVRIAAALADEVLDDVEGPRVVRVVVVRYRADPASVRDWRTAKTAGPRVRVAAGFLDEVLDNFEVSFDGG